MFGGGANDLAANMQVQKRQDVREDFLDLLGLRKDVIVTPPVLSG
jgi:hypothetical protein